MLKIRTLIHFGRTIDLILGARQLARAPEMHFSATRCFQSVIFHVLKIEENSNFSSFLSAIWHSGVRARQYIKSIAQKYDVTMPESSVEMKIMYVLKNLYGDNFYEHAKFSFKTLIFWIFEIVSIFCLFFGRFFEFFS